MSPRSTLLVVTAALRQSALVALSVLGLVITTGCSSGGSDKSSSIDCGATTFCLTECSLGCTISGGCTINSIAQNQPISLSFSQAIDPTTVNASSISLKTANGEAPTGRFEIDGSRIRFMPEVRVIANVTTFGFRPNEQYILTLPGGPDEQLSLRSMSGDRLSRTVACTLDITGGLVDLNNKAPEATLISPLDGETEVPAEISIIVEFDELIDTLPFQGGSTEQSPIKYRLKRVNPDGSCPDTAGTTIPGVPRADVVSGGSPRTRVTLRPLIALPSNVCVEVEVTDQVRDVSGTPAKTATFRFFTATGAIQVQTVTESFAQSDKFDAKVSSASWGGGQVAPGQIGGGGQHGSFDISLLQLSGGEFVWDTDATVTVPADQTLLGEQALSIVDGQAEFTDFVIAEGQRLRFTGSKAPVIRVAGNAQIDGEIILDGRVAAAPPSGEVGGPGGQGGPAGGRGGRGADAWLPDVPSTPVPATPTSINAGQDGETLQPPAGSGYAGQVAGTAGRGAPWFPTSGLHADVNTIVSGFYSSQQISGAGGGGFHNAGSAGEITVLLRLPTDPPNDTAAPAAGGSAVPFQPPAGGTDSLEHFLIGGSGGGGGGSVATLVRPAILSPLWMRWTNGFGGGGGGGTIGLRVGRGLSVGPNGRLSAAGGGAASSLGNSWSARGTSVSGGGSAGSILLQVGLSVSQSGTIDLRGGTGGTYGCAAPGGRPGESKGGNGAPGFVRLETPGASIGALGTVLGPNLSANNVASLTAEDPQSIARSTWYLFNTLLEPQFLRYELTVTVDGVTTTFTDDPANPNLANVPGAPVRLKLQSAKIDRVDLTPLDPPGPWVDSVQQFPSQDTTGFRFLLLLDRTTASTITVDEIKVFYQ